MSGCNCNNTDGNCSDRLGNINMPTGEQGIPGTNGTNGEDGKGYDASSTSSIDVLDTADTSVSIVITVDKAYSPGARVRVSKVSAPTTNYFEGICTAYNYVTGDMTISSIDVKEGSGTATAWNVNLAGEPGLDGEQGEKGDDGDTTVFITELIENPETLNQLKSLLFPTFSIITWGGNVDDYFNADGTGKKVGNVDLTGWGLCDSRLGDYATGWYNCAEAPLGRIPIPPLQEKFIAAWSSTAGDYEDVGLTNGIDSNTIAAANLPIHDHNVTVGEISNTNSAHSHSITESSGLTGTESGFSYDNVGELVERKTGYPTTNGANPDGAHTHPAPTVTESTFGEVSPTALDNRPSFYVLAYIIKIDA